MKERIKNLRKSLKMTQKEFADNLGLKRQTIAAYEIGKIIPSDSTMLLICRKFGVEKAWLQNGIGEMYKKRTKNQEIQDFANTIMEMRDDTFKKKFILSLSKLDERDWEAIRKITDYLMKED